MAEKVDQGANNLVSIDLLIEGKTIVDDFLIESVYIIKEVNKISFCKILIHESGSIEKDFKVGNSSSFTPGNKVEVKLGYDDKNQSVFKGIITSHGLKLNKNTAVISIECRDEAIKLTAGRKNAIFEDCKDSDIINKIVKAAGFQCTVDSTKVTHKEVVQHYCSDWDFVMMRAETNGLLVTTNDGKVEVKKPDLSGTPALEVIYGENMISFSAEVDATNQFESVTSVAWDMSNQKLITSSSKSTTDVAVGKLKTKTLSDVIGGKEYILQSSINMPQDALEVWATAKHLKSGLSKIKGKVEFKGNDKMEPGGLLKLSNLSQNFNGDAFVGAVEHQIEGGTWKTTAHLGVGFEWYTQETPMIDAPSASGLIAPFKGLAIAIVKQIHEDKDGQYRVKVAFPTLQKDNLMVWARLSSFYATQESGAFFYPEIGDEVVVGFLNEDPQHPVIMGMLYSSKNKTPFTPDQDNKIKALVTKSKLTIQFDDKDKIIEIVTPDKNSIKIDDKEGQILITDKNKNTLLLSKDGVSIETEKDFVVKAKGKITMEATSDISLKATGDLKGEGMNVALEGKTKFAAKGAMVELEASGIAKLKGSMVNIN